MIKLKWTEYNEDTNEFFEYTQDFTFVEQAIDFYKINCSVMLFVEFTCVDNEDTEKLNEVIR